MPFAGNPSDATEDSKSLSFAQGKGDCFALFFHAVRVFWFCVFHLGVPVDHVSKIAALVSPRLSTFSGAWCESEIDFGWETFPSIYCN